ncbi:MAG TPA: LuxR C-terminal-related transcriptional regulator [Thermomicrobiales bacterium]|nr:LuxR C-terminal-related transcriptional regulator [Thermomicrobiales bacterium]
MDDSASGSQLPGHPAHRHELLSSRLRPHRLRGKRVDRPRLIERLREAPDGSVTLVVAPAGYGKSTLLAQWAASSDVPVAWVSLTASENHPVELMAYLVAALRAAGVQLPGLDRLGNDERSTDMTSLMSVLLADLRDVSSPVALVLDDYDAIDEHATNELVRTLIDSGPAGLRLIIGSRAGPALPLERLRLDGRMHVIGVDELRFSVAETQDFCNLMNLADSGEDSVDLQARTGGWVAALQLAMISIGDGARSAADLLGRFDATNQYLHEFLLQEVLGTQSSAMRSFMLQSALLDRFSVDLCRETLDLGEPAQDLLDRSIQTNLFVEPVEEAGGWYQHHPLFREFLLRHGMTALGERERIAVYERASVWHEQYGLNHEAIDYALHAGNWPRATRLIVPVAARLSGREGMAAVVEWFKVLPAQLLVSDPELAAFAALTGIRTGVLDDVPRLLTAAQELYEAAGDQLGLAHVSSLHAAVASIRGDGPMLIQHAHRTMTLLDLHERQSAPADGPHGSVMDPEHTRVVLRGLAQMHEGNGFYCLGKATEAAQAFDAVCEYSDVHGLPVLAAGALNGLGHVRLMQGRLDDAIAAYEGAAADGRLNIVSRRIGLMYLADIYRERDQLSRAETMLEECSAIMNTSRLPIWHGHLLMQQARLAWSCGETQQALELAQHASRSARDAGIRWLERRSDAFAMRVRVADGDIGAAIKWVYDRHLSPDDPPTYEHLWEHLAYSRALIAHGEPGDAVGLLTRAMHAAEVDGRNGEAIRVGVLLALAYLDLAQTDTAVDVLARSLRYGEHGGYLRVFADEGMPMIHLLKLARERGITPTYCTRILDALEAPGGRSAPSNRDARAEDITDRDIELLRMFAAGTATEAIADTLGVSTSTANWHVANLYRKLGVWTRVEALDQARALNLVPGDDASASVP